MDGLWIKTPSVLALPPQLFHATAETALATCFATYKCLLLLFLLLLRIPTFGGGP